MLSIQSGPAGASPTRFWPADRIARLTPEASYARLHREADLDKIGATIGNRGTPPDWRSAAGPQKQVRSAPPKRPIRAAGYRAKLRGSAFHSRYVPFGHRQRRPRLRSL